MRTQNWFILVLAGLFGALAVLTLSLNEHGLFFFHQSHDDIEQTLTAFQKKHDAKLELNLSELYGDQGHLQMLHPILDVMHFQISEVEMTCSTESMEAPTPHAVDPACRPPSAPISASTYKKIEQKSHFLTRFLNHQIAALPEDFLTTPPFFDAKGTSFAYTLTKNDRAPYNQASWIGQNLSAYKPSELKEILASFKISDSSYVFITQLSDAEIEMAVRGEQVILTNSYLLLRNQSKYGFSPLSYWVYDRAVFEASLKGGKFELTEPRSDTYCIEKAGNACWTYSSAYALSYVYKYSVAILFILGGIFIFLVSLYFRRLHERQKEHQKHRLSLQVLSHEFRTPVSSMLLLMETLGKNHHQFSEKDQDLLTRLSSEIFRLQRLVEVSKKYLQTTGGKIHFAPIEIPSVNTWISDFVAESNHPIQFRPLSKDEPLVADPFWFKFVLSNLVQNAFAHGAEPVQIVLESTAQKINISVQDQGLCEFKTLPQMLEPFVKSPASQGMGLGLNMVQHIANEWGSEIRYQDRPTCFTFSLNKTPFKEFSL